MKINNPQSLMGYTRANASEFTYNLATIGQVSAAVQKVNTKFENLLFGGSNGVVSNGFAWLDANKKIPYTLLPDIAITDVFPITQTQLKNAGSLAPTPPTMPAEATSFERLMNSWLAWAQTPAGGSKSFQKGDVIVVTVPEGEKADPLYAGSYIITTTGSSTTHFEFSRLAYTDGNIVSINDKTPDGTGALRIELEDVLNSFYINKTDMEFDPETGISQAAMALKDAIYKISEEGSMLDGYRFKFDGNPYAKLAELNAAKAALDADVVVVSGAIDRARADLGERSDLANRAETASIFAQTKQLRVDADTNAINIDIIHQNVTNLNNAVSGQAVALFLKTITWGATDGNTAPPFVNEWGVTTDTDATDPVNYLGSDPREIGEVTWIYNYKSTGSDETVLAVYDETGNQISVDLTVSEDAPTGLRKTAIMVKTAYYGRENDGTTIVNSIFGKSWKVLVAKVINNFGDYRTI